MKTRIAILAVILSLIFTTFASAATQLPHYADQIILETNAERIEHGLPAYRIDPELMAAAQTRALELTQKFSHTRPNGRTGSSVSPLARNENIARGQKTPDKVMAAWLTSPSHRQNILSSAYTCTGMACVKAGNIYHWVQLFGK